MKQTAKSPGDVTVVNVGEGPAKRLTTNPANSPLPVEHLLVSRETYPIPLTL